MSGAVDARTPGPLDRLPRAARTLIAIAATAAVLWAALAVTTGLFVAAAFGAWWASLIGLAVLLVLEVLAITALLRVGSGRRHRITAVVIVLVSVVGLGLALARFGQIPMVWVAPGFELVHPVVAVASALIPGIAIGPRWMRVVCGMLVAGALAAAVWWVAATTEPPADPLAQPLAQQEANFEAYVAGGDFPLVADLPSGTIVDGTPLGGPPTMLVRTAAGGVVAITTDRTPVVEQPDSWPCWFLADGGRDLESTDSLADVADWCVQDGERWRRVDGLGIARLNGAGLVAVSPASTHDIATAGGDRPATSEEIAAVFDALRPMTEREVRSGFPAG